MPNSNTLTAVIPQLLAQALPVLRESAFMPRLVNRKFETTAGEKFSTIDIPIGSAITASDVTPGPTPPDNAGVTPTTVPIPVDTWKDASFFMSDKDLQQVQSGIIPLQAANAVRALANAVNGSIFGLYKKVYGYAGTAGTTPFASDLAGAVNVRKVLNTQLAPKGMRRLVLDSDAEGNALLLRAIQDQSWRTNASGLIDGVIARTLGFDWFGDETNVPTHTKGAAGTVLIDQADVAVGDTEVHLDGLTTKASVGDVFTVAGDEQTYTVLTASDLATNDGDITFAPAAKVAWANDAAVTFKATHVVNLAFHQDAFALVSRPFVGADPMNLGNFDSIVDPESGLVLRLEVTRQHKRTNFAFDVLYGVGCPRPELAARLAG